MQSGYLFVRRHSHTVSRIDSEKWTRYFGRENAVL